MSSESPSKESDADAPLPFERVKNRKKTAKTPPKPPIDTPKATKSTPVTSSQMAIPDIVSKRMVQRMALLCGIPTILGISTFLGSYIVVSQHWMKLPNVVVLLLSMGFFGLGVLGLSYGVLSTSWDEEVSGSILGWEEFKINFGRMTGAWRSVRQKD